ncbi:hypothetical protein [Bacillus sp. FJAT-45350]|uniref:hypothetical protein n=1 Tax=Bacillus sp. FJAT-45350 TaxID=2011014 RepID=UPI00115502BA|nr:hypothetical protein [Bacillus sp. FJAT-45350]
MIRLLLLGILSMMTLAGCYNTNTNELPSVITENNNQRLHVSYQGTEHTVINDSEGFYLLFEISHLDGPKLTKDNFDFSLLNILKDNNGTEYTSLSKEIVTNDENGEPLPEGTLAFKQFFTPKLDSNEEKINLSFFIKPLYYSRDIIFENISEDINLLTKNDMTIGELKTEENKLSVKIGDVHDIRGLEVSMIYDGEEIFPAFSSTDVNQEVNQMQATYTFTNNIPPTFSLKFTRHRLQDIVWEFPLMLPVE